MISQGNPTGINTGMDALIQSVNKYAMSDPNIQQHLTEAVAFTLPYGKNYLDTAQNILKVFALLEHYPDLSLFIHVNPIFCCPGLVSESIFKKVEKDIGIPIVSITYDGTTTRRNDILAPYIHYLKQTIPSQI